MHYSCQNISDPVPIEFSRKKLGSCIPAFVGGISFSVSLSLDRAKHVNSFPPFKHSVRTKRLLSLSLSLSIYIYIYIPLIPLTLSYRLNLWVRA
ncbi:hypothetical protein VNO78_19130 [Psophocarpus tetragonolobus]|uniref:Uncharacterized protein n=1 Tax=Psophocarpus tetragonolobus TaxID=3891 RepID=A0AAN9XG50_PSOTE